MADNSWETVLAGDLTNERDDGEAAWQAVEFRLDRQRDYPVNHEVAERLIRAFNAVRETPLIIRSLCCMMKLSMTYVDMIDVDFIELVCDVFFTSTHVNSNAITVHARYVHEWLNSERFILEEIRGLPMYADYGNYLKNMENAGTQDADLNNRVHAIYNDFKDVPQSGRLTKRASADS